LPALFGQGVEVLGGAEVPLDPDLHAHSALFDDPLPDVGALDPNVDAGPAQHVGTADAGALQ
jgi:hypothetical protein